MSVKIQYTGSESLEMMQTYFPKTWENEIVEGRVFLLSLMKMYKLTAVDAYTKYLKYCQNTEKMISITATLHVMNTQVRIVNEIKECRTNQSLYGKQVLALENSKQINWEDTKILRSFYCTKQNELQQRIDTLIKEYPVIGAQTIVVQTNLFDN